MILLTEADCGLPARTLHTIDDILLKYDGVERAVLYGSRAKGNYRRASDIDITLITVGDFPRTGLLHIHRDFDESSMPYKVDVSLYDHIENASLRDHIKHRGKVLYTRESERK
jgi:predicted nucleotidyltransferase